MYLLDCFSHDLLLYCSFQALTVGTVQLKRVSSLWTIWVRSLMQTDTLGEMPWGSIENTKNPFQQHIQHRVFDHGARERFSTRRFPMNPPQQPPNATARTYSRKSRAEHLQPRVRVCVSGLRKPKLIGFELLNMEREATVCGFCFSPHQHVSEIFVFRLGLVAHRSLRRGKSYMHTCF